MRAKRSSTITTATTLPWSDASSPIPVTSDDPMRGDRDALVTIVVFSDFQCPFCSRLEKTLDDVRARYPSNEVRILWKNEPLAFHKDARPAAEAAQGVFVLGGSGAFWTFHDRAFANQSALTASNFELWARDSGVDPKKLRSGLGTHLYDAKVDDDDRLAKSLGVTGTPTSFVNGVTLSGAQPLATFQSTIDSELTKARAKVAMGIPRDEVYVTMSRENWTAKAKPVPTVITPPAAPAYVMVPVGTSPVRGSPTALVTIVEFSEFQCPYCKMVEPTLTRVRTEYGTDVRVVWKNEPLAFHPRAEPAAQMALEARAQAGDGAFWTAHDSLYGAPTLDDTTLLDLAKKMGLDSGKVSTAILTHKHKKVIDDDTALASSVKATGTPTFFINGRTFVGAQPYAEFKRVIDEELVRARLELARGTPRADLYDKLAGGPTGLAVPPIPSDLIITDTKLGSGLSAKPGDTLSVHYTGTLQSDGKKFDSSYDHGGTPFQFELGAGKVIKGWEQGLLGMRSGGKRRLVIPPELGYGVSGRPPTIPPNATLVFEIELLSIR
jgi:protein-disulfide isomerase